MQSKHGSRLIADRFVKCIAHTTVFSGKRLKVVSMLAQFWASPNLNRIASPRQLLFVTYMLYEGLKACGEAAFSTDADSVLFDAVRMGI